ncbi:MAG: SPOR domain-containing protein [Prevotella sp.]|jgi:cell division septation protein DedD
MIEIQRHIEILLLDNDCVIVPNFGGFMAHHVSARYDENDGSFLPPLRTIGFNPQLTMNDSLLAQSYIEAYDISYPEALRRIEEEVSEIRQHIDNEGYYELTDLGTLGMNQEGNITFEPCEAGILTPNLYGLSNFSMNPLSVPVVVEQPKPKEVVTEKVEAETEKAVPVAAEEKPKKEQPTLNEILMQNSEDEEKHHIVIPVSWVRNTLAIAVVILAFFLIPSKLSEPSGNKVQKGDIDTELLIKVMPKASSNNKPVQLKAAKDTTSKPAKAQNVDTAKTVTNCYSLVLASKVTKRNANEFVKLLQSNGYKEARVYTKKGKATKVLYGSYKTENEARKVLRSLRDKPDFEQAWIIYVKG